MKTLKNLRLILLWIIILYCATILFFCCKNQTVYAMDSKIDSNHVGFDIFSNREIEQSGYLCNFDNSADYIFVDFAGDNGYAIFANETMELLEYSLEGDLPYKDLENDTNYYGGPNLYLEKNKDKFINVVNGESFNFSELEIYEKAQTIRNKFSISNQNVNFKESVLDIEKKLQSIQSLDCGKLSDSPKDPPLDEKNWIYPTDGATYIKNSEYFLTKGASPRHGVNSDGSCTTVATQLLLSFNNYYNDRRIIPPEYLYGWWLELGDNDVLNPANYMYPWQNPHTCENPSSKTSEILGSTQAYHDYLYDNGVTSWIWAAANNLKPLLNSRNIDYTLIERHTPTNVPIGSTDIINELNQGYPVVLATSQSLNGTPYDGQRDFNHSVIAYGYQEFAPYSNDTNSYLGYIVHLGWDNNATGNKINVWTNSSWYYDYMTLHVNHIHNYNVFCNGEARCGECNHRVASDYNLRDLGNNNVEIISMNNHSSGALNIPETLYGKTVASIGDSAFANQSWLTEIRIPGTVTSIGHNAFTNATALKSVAFMEAYAEDEDGYEYSYIGLKTIGNAAFSHCTELQLSTLPASITEIGYNAFEGCTSLGVLTFASDSQLTTIYNGAFIGCTMLLTTELPAKLTTIGANAFQDCTSLISVYSEDNCALSSIGNSAFEGCSALHTFEMPSAVNSIGYYAFRGCAGLMTVVLSNNLSAIGANAFAGCEKLTIYTSQFNTASGWMVGWNSMDRPIVFGCELKGSTPYVSSFTKSASNPLNINATNGVSAPRRATYYFKGWFTTSDFSGTQYDNIASAPNGTLYAKWEPMKSSSCIAEGSMITLADGSQVAVEDLQGNEQLLVWNMLTGQFDTAPILFIDSDPQREYEIVNLYFSDGTSVKVISEHAFWDFDLNKYVYLRSDAHQYIGHWFNKQITNADGDMAWIKVQLVGVELTNEITTAWSPVTYGHLCYYVNGMLSMPGATEGLVNIFDVDADTMKYDDNLFIADVEKYGLFTYDEFAQIVPVPQEMFDAFNGQYLKVAIGKGLIDIDRLVDLIESYGKFF